MSTEKTKKHKSEDYTQKCRVSPLLRFINPFEFKVGRLGNEKYVLSKALCPTSAIIIP